MITGSYFAMDTNGNSKIQQTEKSRSQQGTTGLIIGTTTAAGASHGGAPTAGDTNAIDAPWFFFNNTGSDYTTVGVTGSTTAGLNMSGWTVTWNSIPAIPMGTGAWATGTGAGHTGATGTFTNGVGNFTWDGVYGDAYSLDYRATVPVGDPSGFGGVQLRAAPGGRRQPVRSGPGRQSRLGQDHRWQSRYRECPGQR